MKCKYDTKYRGSEETALKCGGVISIIKQLDFIKL